MGFLWGWGDDKNILKLSVMVAQLCEYTKNDWIAHSKWVSYMVCESQIELYLYNAVTPKMTAKTCELLWLLSASSLACEPQESTGQPWFCSSPCVQYIPQCISCLDSKSICWLSGWKVQVGLWCYFSPVNPEISGLTWLGNSDTQQGISALGLSM